MKRIQIFDTTLRDGEQSPGCSMNIEEKIEVAKQLEKLGVDVIEAGFAIASDGDFEAVKAIAKCVKHTVVASLARATYKDIDRAYQAVKEAVKPRIHTFIATSDIHMEFKLKMTRTEVLERTKTMVAYAKDYLDDVEFSCEDATRTQPEFLVEVIETAIEAGATVINIPDTVGYATPDTFYELIDYVKKHVTGIEKITLSVHCHNDLGLAVANSLSAIKAGADQIECTINGLGERAGNAALEEIVMAINTRKDVYAYTSNITSKEIHKTSSLISYITGVKVQPNKAIVGANAFAHESGIHQHGVLSNSMTYEIMTPESVGLSKNVMVLGKHSGKHGFRDRLRNLGFDLDEVSLSNAFDEFKNLLDKKKKVYDSDLIAIVRNETIPYEEIIKLIGFNITTGSGVTTTAMVQVEIENENYQTVAMGDGPVDAAFKAIQSLTNIEVSLTKYELQAVSRGKDAQGDANIRVVFEDYEYTGRGLSTDVIEASIYAYLSVFNKILKDAVTYNKMQEVLEINIS